MRNHHSSRNNIHPTVHSDDVKLDTVQVPRTIGLTGSTAIIVGSIIGSGIFISPQGVAQGAGSVGLSLICWTIYGLISMLGALCYAELSSVIKSSGADYAFLDAAFGPLPAFVFIWAMTVFINCAGMATMALTCAHYIMVPLFSDECGAPPQHIIKLIGVLIIGLLCAISVSSVRLMDRIQIVFTAAKLLAVLIIILGGFVLIAKGRTGNLTSSFSGTEIGLSNIAGSFYSGMWAYGGWDSVSYIVEDIKRPTRNVPLSIVLGLSMVIVVYILINVSYFTVISMSDLFMSPAVAMVPSEFLMFYRKVDFKMYKYAKVIVMFKRFVFVVRHGQVELFLVQLG